MLKFTYTETGLYIERLNQSLEEIITLRILLAMRFGQRLMVEPGSATFLLPARSPHRDLLDSVTKLQNGAIEVYCCDADFVEVKLRGIWVAQDYDQQEGIFLVELGDFLPASLCERAEFILFKLWQDSLTCQSLR